MEHLVRGSFGLEPEGAEDRHVGAKLESEHGSNVAGADEFADCRQRILDGAGKLGRGAFGAGGAVLRIHVECLVAGFDPRLNHVSSELAKANDCFHRGDFIWFSGMKKASTRCTGLDFLNFRLMMVYLRMKCLDTNLGGNKWTRKLAKGSFRFSLAV